MNNIEASVAVAVVVCVLAVVFVLRYRSRGSINLVGPFGTKLEAQGSNDDTALSSPSITAKRVSSAGGSIKALDGTGRGIHAEDLAAEKDVNLRVSVPSAEKTTSKPSIFGEGFVAGGNITIQQFVSNSDLGAAQLSFFASDMGLPTRAALFADAQFASYCQVWKLIHGVRIAGDNLWQKASDENILDFSNKLHQLNEVAREGEIFFEESDRVELLEILDTFKEYRLGKLRLVSIRTRDALSWLDGDEGPSRDNQVRWQIENNGEMRSRYENLIDRLRISFRDRLRPSPMA